MTAKERFEENKDFIIENLNVTKLFDYFVEHGYMEDLFRDRIVRNPSSAVNENMYSLLSRYVNESNDVFDNLFFQGLMATGQGDIVLKIFPDFKTKSFEMTLHRIVLNRKYIEQTVDMIGLKRYINENKVCVPEYRGSRTHEMKTRSRREDQKTCHKPLWSFLAARIKRDDFDFNTDALIQSLVKSDQINVVKIMFPHILTKVHKQI